MNPDEESSEWLSPSFGKDSVNPRELGARVRDTIASSYTAPSELLYAPRGPLYGYAPSVQPSKYTWQANQAASAVQTLGEVMSKMTDALREANKQMKLKPFPHWSDNVTPGSDLVIIDNIKKKESGVNLRKSVTSDMTLGRPRASKNICRTHGQEYVFNREDLTWGCSQCDKGRVPFSKWYKDTYSLGYFATHCFGAGGRSEMSQEVVLSADENFNSIALMVQRSEPGVDAPVYVTDLGKIAVDLSVKRLPGEDGVRRIDIGELYGVPQNEEEMKPEPDDDDEAEEEPLTLMG